MAMKGNDVIQLADPEFISHLAFLTDITEHLNTLSLKLQGRKHVITQMYDSVKAFKCKLSLWSKQLADGNTAHFLALQSLGVIKPQLLKEYSSDIDKLNEEFDRRFAEFKTLEPAFALFSTPFAIEVGTVSEEFQLELVELQCDTILNQTYADVGIPEFYKYVPREKFPTLVAASARIIAMFGSTYVCEQFFSSMKHNKSALRS